MKTIISKTFSEKTVIKLSSQDTLAGGVQDVFFKFNNEENFQKYDPNEGVSVASLETGCKY